MPKLLSRHPKYLKRDRNIGFFWLNGKRVYLPGEYNSKESLAADNREIAILAEAKSNGDYAKTNKIQLGD